MTIKPELMPKHELEGCREHYSSMPIIVQTLLRHEAWLQELIAELQTGEKYFQARERQRQESDNSLAP